MKFRMLITITILITNVIVASGQRLPPTVRLQFSAGLTLHGALSSNGFNFSDIIWTNHPAYCGGGPCVPYNYERNLQGLGVMAGAGVRMGQIEILFNPEFRYDEIYYSFNGPDLETHKEFVVNPQVSVQRWFAKTRKPQYIGVGYKIVNTAKRFDFYDSVEGEEKTFLLQVPAGLAFCGRALGRRGLFGEFQVYYFYKGLPHNPYGPYFMYGVSVYKKFDRRQG